MLSIPHALPRFVLLPLRCPCFEAYGVPAPPRLARHLKDRRNAARRGFMIVGAAEVRRGKRVPQDKIKHQRGGIVIWPARALRIGISSYRRLASRRARCHRESERRF